MLKIFGFHILNNYQIWLNIIMDYHHWNITKLRGKNKIKIKSDYEWQGGLKNSCIFKKGRRRKGKKA